MMLRVHLQSGVLGQGHVRKQIQAPHYYLRHHAKKTSICGSPYSTPLTTSGVPERLTTEVPDRQQLEVEPALVADSATPSVVTSAAAVDYATAEQTLAILMSTPGLDSKVSPRGAQQEPRYHHQAQVVELTIAAALQTAYGNFASLGLDQLPTCNTIPSLGLVLSALEAGKHAYAQQHQQQADTSASLETASVHNKTELPQGLVQMYSSLNQEDAAHLFLQRTLYRINRLNLFWFDSLDHYINDRSLYLAGLRGAIETPWQAWEADQFGHDTIATIKQMSAAEIKEALTSRYHRDVNPPLSPVGTYVSHDMGLEGYRQLLAIASLDGLVEASRQSRVCGGAANDISCMIFKVLMEEYGAGRLPKKHSTFFASMMRELELDDTPEAYLAMVPWQCLAGANHNFYLTESRRHYLKYAGGLTFFEIVGPSVYQTYLDAAKRLQLSDDASGYWALHIKEDERHGKWMLQDVALPLVDKYPEAGWEVLLGYDQEVFLGRRAANVVLQRIRDADQQGFKRLPAVDN